eukprot:2557956-Amphidinium_carterae.2
MLMHIQVQHPSNTRRAVGLEARETTFGVFLPYVSQVEFSEAKPAKDARIHLQSILATVRTNDEMRKMIQLNSRTVSFTQLL